MLPTEGAMLFSVVNTRLRDEFDSLDELCAAEDVSRAELEARLAAEGYRYDEAENRFVRG